jgi:hypothetical protein
METKKRNDFWGEYEKCYEKILSIISILCGGSIITLGVLEWLGVLGSTIKISIVLFCILIISGSVASLRKSRVLSLVSIIIAVFILLLNFLPVL